MSMNLVLLHSLLHDALLSTEHVRQCAIIRRKDGAIRAQSSGFTMSPSEIQAVLEGFKGNGDLRNAGIVIAGKEYKCVRSDQMSIYGKDGKSGVIITKTNTLVLLGTYDATMYPSVTAEAVEKLADYFREKGK
eukprot:Colp12_sorted_trinity150504_noHs@28697